MHPGQEANLFVEFRYDVETATYQLWNNVLPTCGSLCQSTIFCRLRHLGHGATGGVDLYCTPPNVRRQCRVFAAKKYFFKKPTPNHDAEERERSTNAKVRTQSAPEQSKSTAAAPRLCSNRRASQ